ncbi:hypothetical protein CHS0354_018338 [Potamilus streckersoni]|uniref:VWFA domain-containing protein n=1 Tax=Potamilus streckersoni TaxID=2493646 RepID=A0AAE0RMA2_9BIVA|nr:hypothetical protein CHS0354_018338 [Potamilus streckersoni]
MRQTPKKSGSSTVIQHSTRHLQEGEVDSQATMLKNTDILRKHVLFQTSYTRPSRVSTPSNALNGMAPIYGTRGPPSIPGGAIDTSTASPYEILERRRMTRVQRLKPWQEKGSIVTRRKSGYVELVYESSLPVRFDLAKAQCKLRYYVSNTKHGKLYQIVHNDTMPKKLATAPSKWLWERDFLLWLNEGRKEYTAQKHYKRKDAGSKNESSHDSSRGSSYRSENSQNSSRNVNAGGKLAAKSSKEFRPTAEIFAYYNSYRIEKQRKQTAAVMIQKVIKGWYIRNKIKVLKRKALLEHGRTWKRFIEEYRELVARIQSRYGVMKFKVPLDLKQIQTFMDHKYRYEEAFRKVAYGDKLPKQNLMEFFKACQLYPTELEVRKGFDTVFRGSGNTAEVVFLLDCSSSIGVVTFRDQLHLVRDTVKSLDIAPDRIRVGMIPYSEDIINSFDLKAFEHKEDILKAIEKMEARPGLTRTDLALKLMLDIFKDSRPGVQKIAIVVTDGNSSDAERTKREARAAHESGIRVFAIGVGATTKETELSTIATSMDHVFYAYDAKSFDQIQKAIMKTFCLASCVLCQTLTPRIQQHGILLHEALEILWSMFPPEGCVLACEICSKLTDADKSATFQKDVHRPLLQSEALDIVWTIYPPTASGLSEIRTSRWIRPVSDGQEAWCLLDEKIIKETDFRTCLRLVIESKLARNGFIEVPADVRAGVEEVKNPEEALRIVEDFIKTRKENFKQERLDLAQK